MKSASCLRQFANVATVLIGVAAFAAARASAADSGADVVVIYNAQVPESKAVATHYAQRRSVPPAQVISLDLPGTETITRPEFEQLLKEPLIKKLEAAGLMTFDKTPPHRATQVKARYAVLCFGMPLKILRDDKLVEAGADQLPEPLRRNEAGVDSELACLPLGAVKLTGPLNNPVYGSSKLSALTNSGVPWFVTRIDGPTAAIARGLVDKAMEAETNGLWGRGYFDIRGLTIGEYVLGDEWIRGAAQSVSNAGYIVHIETNATTYPVPFPLSQIAFYAGWYDEHASGPFKQPVVEFMPGAIAYHLHSYSAATLRSTSNHWVGPFLAQGVTATMGCVDEPYLTGTPDVRLFFTALVLGRTSFGEAAFLCQNVLSWQAVFVGDPLYRPFSRRPDLLHADLEKRQSPLADWSHQGVISRNLALGSPPDEMIAYLRQIPRLEKSAVLMELLGDIYWQMKRISNSIEACESALRLDPTPQQKVRLLFNRAERTGVQVFDLFRAARHMATNDPDELIRQALAIPNFKTNSVLLELLGDAYWQRKNFSDALDTYESALKLELAPAQKLSLLLTLADRRRVYGPDKTAYEMYLRVISEFPDYPDQLGIYQKLLVLAKRLEKKEMAEAFEKEIKRLTPAPPPTNTAPPRPSAR